MSKTWQGKLIPITPKDGKWQQLEENRILEEQADVKHMGIHTRTKSERKRVRER